MTKMLKRTRNTNPASLKADETMITVHYPASHKEEVERLFEDDWIEYSNHYSNNIEKLFEMEELGIITIEEVCIIPGIL